MRIISIAIALLFLSSCAHAEPLEQEECQRLDVHKVPANPKALLSEETGSYLTTFVNDKTCELSAGLLTDLIYIDGLLASLTIYQVKTSHGLDQNDVFELRQAIWSQVEGHNVDKIVSSELAADDHAKLLYLDCQRASSLFWEECDPRLFDVFIDNSRNASAERKQEALIKAYKYAKENWEISQQFYRIEK